jgi:Sap, sulfolipid-1-addressing protein
MDLASVLPLAFVMIAGPQIISAFFFATGENWRRESAAFVLGAALSIPAMATVGFFFASKLGSGDSGGDDAIVWGIVALLIFAMAHQFRNRGKSEPPKWMGKLQTATPRLAFTLGFLLLGFFPSDLATSLSVGAHLGRLGHPWWSLLPFVALTLLLLASPALAIALLGKRAQTVLPKIRDWMNTNSWIVSEVVLAFFIVIVLSS